MNEGIEALVNLTLLDRKSFGWDVTLNGSHNTNKILSLGVDATGKPNPTIGTGTTRDSVGLPANGYFYQPYTWSDANHDGLIDPTEVNVSANSVYMGYSQPRDIFSVQNGFDLFNHKIRLTGLIDYKGGFSVFNTTVEFYCANQPTCFEETNKSAPLWQQARNVAQRYTTIKSQAGYLENGQFWRLRELSAILTVPNAVVQRLRAHDRGLVSCEAGRELDERRCESRRQRSRRAACRRRRLLAERREELTDLQLAQRHVCRSPPPPGPVACRRGSDPQPSPQPSSPARRCCRS